MFLVYLAIHVEDEEPAPPKCQGLVFEAVWKINRC